MTSPSRPTKTKVRAPRGAGSSRCKTRAELVGTKNTQMATMTAPQTQDVSQMTERDSLTLMICNIATESKHTDETVRTLQFASRVNATKQLR